MVKYYPKVSLNYWLILASLLLTILFSSDCSGSNGDYFYDKQHKEEYREQGLHDDY